MSAWRGTGADHWKVDINADKLLKDTPRFITNIIQNHPEEDEDDSVKPFEIQINKQHGHREAKVMPLPEYQAETNATQGVSGGASLVSEDVNVIPVEVGWQGGGI
jgi:hypothetical protein